MISVRIVESEMVVIRDELSAQRRLAPFCVVALAALCVHVAFAATIAPIDTSVRFGAWWYVVPVLAVAAVVMRRRSLAAGWGSALPLSFLVARSCGLSRTPGPRFGKGPLGAGSFHRWGRAEVGWQRATYSRFRRTVATERTRRHAPTISVSPA